MAYAIHFRPLPFHRNPQGQLYIHQMQCQKASLHFPVFHVHQIKLYPVPLRVVHASRSFSLKAAVKMNSSTREEGPHSVGPIAMDEFERSKLFLDNSSISVDAVNDFEAPLQEFFNEVKSMILKGNKDGAIYLLKANYVAVKEQIDAGYQGIAQAALLDLIALGYMGVGDFKFVEHILEMLWEIVESLKNDVPLLDSILIHMGSMYTTLGNFEHAKCAYARGLEILEGLFGKNNGFLVMPLFGMAKVFGLTGRTMKAVEIYNRAIKILEMTRGAECKELVFPLYCVGNIYIKEGKATDAEISFRRILSIYTKLYGAKDGRVGVALCSLAHAIWAKGNVDEAINAYGRGLQVIKDSRYLALDDYVLEKMRINLAELLHVAGREREGRQLLEECLRISERYKGKQDPSIATHLRNLASSYSRSKNFVEAERLLRTSLQIMSKAVGPDDQAITVPMLHLAVTLYHLKQDEEAEDLALKALQIRENAFGKQSLPVGEALDCLASVQARLGKDDELLLAHLKRVLSIQEREFGPESEETLVTLKKVVSYLGKTGRKNEKLLLQRRLSMLLRNYRERIRTRNVPFL